MPRLRTLPMGWVALLGIIALLIILNRDDMDQLMHRIEWTTLLFFAAMFVMMECVERLGLFNWIGQLTEYIILCVDKRNRLAMSIFIILWMSALASAILDSVPVTVMMVKLVTSLVSKSTLDLPLEPLVWSLAFGPALGGKQNSSYRTIELCHIFNHLLLQAMGPSMALQPMLFQLVLPNSMAIRFHLRVI